MKIYVACLASYNSGLIHGAWLDLGVGADELRASIEKLIQSSPTPNAEEWAVHDYDCEGLHLDPAELGENPDLDLLYDLVEACEDNQGFDYFLSQVDGSLPSSLDDLQSKLTSYEDSFTGRYESKLQWASESTEHLFENVSDEVSRYFDYSAWLRDREIDSVTFVRVAHGVLVFNTNY